MQKILHFSRQEAETSFIITCVTSPTLGLVLGGFISAKIKNVESGKNSIACVILSFMAAGAALPVPFCNGVWTFIPFLWLLLFFGGAIVPLVTGIYSL